MEKEKLQYYVYLHVRDDKDEVFYVGIGTKEDSENYFKQYHRAYQVWSRNRFWKFIVKKTKYTIKIHKEFDSRIKCEEEEIRLIKKFGRKNLNKGTLVNLTDGGEGLKGCRPINAREVHQYTLKGNYIQSFNTIGEAEEKINCTNVSACCRGIIKTAGKYQWSYDKKDTIEVVKYHTSEATSKKVQQFTKEGKLVNEYDSVNEASRVMTGSKKGLSTISQCCNGIRKTYLGYKWKFKNKNKKNDINK